MNILVAEDNQTTRRILQSELTQGGYNVILARDGTQAGDLLSCADSPKLVLLDWLIPGKAGLELRGAAESGGKYVILLAASSDTPGKMRARRPAAKWPLPTLGTCGIAIRWG